MRCGRASSWCGLGMLPVALFVTLTLSFLTTYLIALKEDHISAAFPYISDTGADPPESCIFTLMLSLCGFLVFCIVFVRYKQVAEYNKQDVVQVLGLNRWSSYMGYAAAFGMLVVASFQEVYVGIVHLVGAMITFGSALVYGWLQCLMTYRMLSSQTGAQQQRSRLLGARVVLCILSTLSFFSTILFMAVAKEKFRVTNDYHKNESMHWKEGDGGYPEHLASAASEWLMGFLYVGFFLTYIKEFQRISLDVHIRLRLRNDFTFSPDRQPLNEGISASDDDRNNDGVW